MDAEILRGSVSVERRLHGGWRGRACTHYANLSFNLASCQRRYTPSFSRAGDQVAGFSRPLDYNLCRLRAIYSPGTRATVIQPGLFSFFFFLL